MKKYYSDVLSKIERSYEFKRIGKIRWKERDWYFGGIYKKKLVPQTVKEVLDAIVADGLVDNDKIGAGNFFWALPSKAGQTVFSRVYYKNRERKCLRICMRN